MDKECTIGFTFVNGGGLTDHTQLAAGVTRDFSEEIWNRIKDYDVVKNLLSLGALRIEVEEPKETRPAPSTPGDSIAEMPLPTALTLVEDSFDIGQLQRWDAKDSRIRVKNAIARRIAAITEGNG